MFYKAVFFSEMQTFKVNLGTIRPWTKEQLEWWYWWNYWQNFMKKDEGENFPIYIYIDNKSL